MPKMLAIILLVNLFMIVQMVEIIPPFAVAGLALKKGTMKNIAIDAIIKIIPNDVIFYFFI